ncbi:ABC transporter permease, partial [Streptomyces vinaceusdrappus]
MSRAEARLPVRVPGPLWSLGLLRSELSVTFRRWRTLALLGVLAAVPVLVGIAVRIETSDGSSLGPGGGGGWGGPASISEIGHNGLCPGFDALAAHRPLILPVA